MEQYRFWVILDDGRTEERQLEAPTRSEARGWLKQLLRAEGVRYQRIISLRPQPQRKAA